MENFDTLAAALAKAQGQMSGAVKNKKNPFFKSSYSDLSAVFDAIREPFSSNGLSVSQPIGIVDGRQVLRTILMHASGQSIESVMLLPDIADPQKLGACITYFRRFSLMAIAGLPAEDDDGNEASRAVQTQKSKYITDAQLKTLEAALSKNPEIRNDIIENLKDRMLANLPSEKFESCIAYVNKRLHEETNG